jgi:hypothetical protein
LPQKPRAGRDQQIVPNRDDPTKEDAARLVAQEIMRYFDEHPDAADTAEWISRWWLLHLRHEETAGLVQAALDRLVEDGLVTKRASFAGAPVYSRARTLS